MVSDSVSVASGNNEDSIKSIFQTVFERLTQHDKSHIHQKLQTCLDCGCCVRCILRFFSVDLIIIYQTPEPILIQYLNQFLTKHNLTLLSSNLCQICFGLLQDVVLNQVLFDIKAKLDDEKYEINDSFKLLCKFPASCVIREHGLSRALNMEITEKSPILMRICFKWTLGGLLEHEFGIHFDSESSFFVSIAMSHSETQSEIDWILNCTETTFNHQRIRNRNKHKKSQNTSDVLLPDSNVPSHNFVESLLTKLSESETVRLFHSEFKIQFDRVKSNVSTQIEFQTAPVFVAGRYTKYSRQLSQSPWPALGLDDENDIKDAEDIVRSEICVESLIVPKIQEYWSAEKAVFSSSGREDVDVRMLGEGRPFVVELENVRKLREMSSDQILELEKSINDSALKLIGVQGLAVVPFHDVVNQRRMDSEKRKLYRCIVYSRSALTSESIRMLNECGELKLNQKTPVRVLHRRTALTRTRTIYEMKCSQISDHFLKLDVLAEAGTYIKEFVHGDFGRTQPNVSSLINSQQTEIIQLDVLQVIQSNPLQ